MPDDTTILSLPLILPAQAQKHVTHNEALVQLDLIVQLAVINRTLTTAPALPSIGDRHIVAAGATGPWVGQAGRIAMFTEAGWQFTQPLAGWQAYVMAESQMAFFNGLTWIALSDGPFTVGRLGVSATPDATNRLTVSSPATLLNHAGSGHQLKLNKAVVSDTASLLFQTGFGGRAEMGTAGSDDFSVKVSSDGSSWSVALVSSAATGEVTLPQPMHLGGQAADPGAPVDGTLWLNTTTGEVKVRSAGVTQVVGGGGGVSDGDKGDITVSGSGTSWVIDAGAVTLGKLADIATDSFLGRDTAGTGVPEALSPAQARGILNVANGATANATDAALRDRATHTGTQAAATITGLASVATSGSASDLGAGILPAARFDDTAHGARAGGTLHATVVAGGAAGFMTGADKTKLDGVATGANNYTHPNHTGDVTSVGDGATTIAADAVTNAKLANMATATFKGRTTAGTGDPEDLTVAQAKTLLNLTGTNSGDQTITLTGDVTGSGTGSFAATVANNAVTNAKAADMASATLKGRATAGTGDPEDLTGTQATALLDVFASGTKGLAPASGGGTVNFLRADGSWAAPAGGGGGGDVTAAAAFGTDNRVVRSDGTGKGVQASTVTIDDTGNASGFVNLTQTGYHDLVEIAAPATPGADTVRIYAVDDNTNTRLQYKLPDGTTVQVARDNIFVCRNRQGSTITKGQVVYISGGQGTTGTAEVQLARADSLTTLPAVGIVTESIANNGYGRVMFGGKLEELDTSAFAEGDKIYLSAATAGALTATAPTGANYVQLLGVVINAHPSLGTIAIVQSGFRAASAGGGGSPGGASGEIQFNSSGAFAGAADVEIEGGQLRLPSIATPTAPAADGVKVFGRKVGGRMMPAFMGPSGLDTAVQPSFARNKMGLFMPAGNGGADSQIGFVVTAAGTATTENVATTNLHNYMRRRSWRVTTASTTAVAGLRGGALQWTLGGTAAGLGGFHMVWRWGPATGVATATHRAFVGMRNSTAAPTDVNPSTQTNICGMGYDAADTNVQFMHNDGAGTATKIDLGAGFPKPNVDLTSVYEVALFSPPGTTQTLSYEVTNLVTGAVATGTVTTDLPTTSTLLNPYGYMSVGGTSSVIGFATMGLYIESDI